jgi:competence protein ComEC
MESPNDASVVLAVEHGATRWLLTGDAEAAGEAALLARFGERLKADVVKVGHHGSRTSSTPPLVDAAGQPQFAVVSVARRNRYGLPDEEPIARWAATGAAVLHTSTEGAVWLRSDGESIERVDWRRR